MDSFFLVTKLRMHTDPSEHPIATYLESELKQISVTDTP